MRRTSLVFSTLLTAAFLCLGGCSGDDGKDGAAGTPGAPGVPGTAGTAGTDGTNGLNCWDLNQNGVADLATEDTDKNGTVDVNDCRAPSGAYDPAGLHKGYFTENAYTGTSAVPVLPRQRRRRRDEDRPLEMAEGRGEHRRQQDRPTDTGSHGKIDLINNFCQAVPSNEGRCSQCHIGYGWQDKNFDFGNPKNIDCLACHDQTGTYKKVAAPTATQPVAGGPDMTVEALQQVAQSVGQNAGVPPRSTCVFCHSRAGGDDNVKHGDVSTRMALVAPTNPDADVVTYLHRSEDVHMGVDPKATGSQKKGGNMTCVACHQAKKDAAGNMLDHGIGGFMYHSVDEGKLKGCTDCHGEATSIHIGTSVENLVQIARSSCLPGRATSRRSRARFPHTSTGAGRRRASTPPAGSTETHPADCAKTPLGVTATGAVNRSTYNKLKGCFTWGTNVRPTLRFYNGKWNRVIMGLNDKGLDTTQPVDLGSPAASYKDADAMIYPFKTMTGNQAVRHRRQDRDWSRTCAARVTGPNPYWTKFDWNLALQDSAAYSTLPAFNNTPYGGVQVYNLARTSSQTP